MAEQYPGYQGGTAAAKPNNNLVLAIVCLILCCLPLGVVSLIFALQVDGKWNQGDYQGAQDSAQKAKTWALVGIIGGAVINIALVIVYVLVIAAATTVTVITTTTRF